MRGRVHELLEHAQEGASALLVAPTGAGKTLAGFLPSLVELAEQPRNRPGGGLHTPPTHWYPNWQSPSLLQVPPPPSTQRPPLQICPSPQSPLEAHGLGPWPCTATLK